MGRTAGSPCAAHPRNSVPSYARSSRIVRGTFTRRSMSRRSRPLRWAHGDRRATRDPRPPRPPPAAPPAPTRRLPGRLHGSSADVAWSSATWGRILGDPNRTVLVAEDRGEFAVGTADVLIVPTLTHDGSPWALVENVVVDLEWRRRGVGRALVTHAVRVAHDAGCYKLQLTSSDHRDGAHRFYERLGFTATSTGFRWSFDDRERVGAA